MTPDLVINIYLGPEGASVTTGASAPGTAGEAEGPPPIPLSQLQAAAMEDGPPPMAIERLQRSESADAPAPRSLGAVDIDVPGLSGEGFPGFAPEPKSLDELEEPPATGKSTRKSRKRSS